MNRSEIFQRAKTTCVESSAEMSDLVLQPIVEQLDYLIARERGEAVDSSLIQNIDIGLRALRNLEEINLGVAKELYRVQKEAEQIPVENGMKNRLAV